MPSETMYSCGKQRDDNPTHLSQVSQVSQYIVLSNKFTMCLM